MNRGIIFCPALVLSMCLAGCVTTDSPGPYRISGVVQDVQGRPVAKAPVEFYSDSMLWWQWKLEQRSHTDAKGAFHFSGTNEDVTVLMRQPGSAITWRSFTSSADDFSQTPLTLSAPMSLSGTVMDESGQPVADAEVWTIDAASTSALAEGQSSYDLLKGPLARQLFSTHTSEDGHFRIDGFPTNTVVNLTASKPGKALREPPLEPGHTDTMQFRVGQQDCKLVLEPGGVIEGKIVAQENSQPLAGVKISLKRAQATYSTDGGREPVESAADGTFRFAGLSAGKYWVGANFGHAPERVAESIKTSVELGKTTRDVVVMASKGGLIRATVIDAKSRKPLAHVGIGTDGIGGTTDDRGVTLVRLLPGNHDVYAVKSGWSMGQNKTQVELGRTNELQFALPPPVKIKGVLRDPSGAPAGGVRVWVFPATSGEPTRTDAKGRFEITWNPRPMGALDTYPVNALIARDWRRNLALAQGIEETYKTVDLRLQPALAVTGVVNDEHGKPITNAMVKVDMSLNSHGKQGYSTTASGLENQHVNTDAQGRFNLAVLPQNQDLSLIASAQGYNWAGTNLDANATGTNQIELAPLVLKHIP